MTAETGDWRDKVNCLTAPRIFVGVFLAMAGETCFRLAAIIGGPVFLEAAKTHGVGRARDRR